MGSSSTNVNDISESMNIQANSSRLLHVVFSDSDFANTDVNAPRRYACISTFDRLETPLRGPAGQTNNLRVEDSFTNGEFVVEITITSDEGHYTTSRFLINVDTDWTNLKMKKLTRFGRLPVLRNIINHFGCR
jgi:hypothetical protein